MVRAPDLNTRLRLTKIAWIIQKSFTYDALKAVQPDPPGISCTRTQAHAGDSKSSDVAIRVDDIE